MKGLKFVGLVLVILVILYAGAIFAGFNLPKPAFLDKGIEGSAELKVTLLMDNNVKNPLSNIEVDVAEKPGQPPKGGAAITNEQGVATFKIKPGSYVIYFNNMNFPKNLSVPESQAITVVDDKINEKILLITTKGNN
jgi:hypothetical protein